MANCISVSTLGDPEFINITSISPLISKCEIKVLYVGENRNRSYISKEVAAEMAQTLPGTPIVGYYIDNKEDFGDHGQQMVIDGEGIKINTLTKPYGFVAPDSKVWFQNFEESDDFGNTIVREYLMTEGYLWTEQFEECKRVLANGNPQSMELDEKTLKGHWSENVNKGIEFFIINDAIFSKLCILGEDVEPCFEGANVTAPDVSSHFSKNDFNKTLFTMMQELKFALQGGEDMENEMVVEETSVISQDEVVETVTTNFEENVEEAIPAVEESPIVEEETPSTEFEAETEVESTEVEVAEEPVDAEVEPVPADAEFACKEDKTKHAAKSQEDEESEEEAEASEEESDSEEKEDDEEDKKNYALLEQKYNELESKFAAMTEEYQALVEFKNSVENEKKEELINSFYMLDEADKADVIANKAQYSYDEIEAKLSVIFARKQMSVAEVEEIAEETVATTYTLVDDMAGLPDWVKAVRETENLMN